MNTTTEQTLPSNPPRRCLLDGKPPLIPYDKLVADLITRLDSILQKPITEGTLNYWIPDWHIAHLRLDIEKLAQHLINRGVRIEEI